MHGVPTMLDHVAPTAAPARVGDGTATTRQLRARQSFSFSASYLMHCEDRPRIPAPDFAGARHPHSGAPDRSVSMSRESA